MSTTPLGPTHIQLSNSLSAPYSKVVSSVGTNFTATLKMASLALAPSFS